MDGGACETNESVPARSRRPEERRGLRSSWQGHRPRDRFHDPVGVVDRPGFLPGHPRDDR